MRNLIKVTAVAIAIAGITPIAVTASQGDGQEATQAVEKTATFTIAKMTCATCPITVRKAMSKVDGVTSVKTDFEKKTAVVVYDSSKASLKAIAAASTNAGYPATLSIGSGE